MLADSTKDEIDKDAQMVEQYLNRLAPGSRRTISSALERIAAVLSDGKQTASSYDWRNINQNNISELQQLLINKYNYKPATVNKMISALRGVLREINRHNRKAQRQLHQAEHTKSLPASSETQLGRVIVDIAIKAMLGVCARDKAPIGARDAALITVFVCGGLRRSEAVSLVIGDYDREQRTLRVRKNEDVIDRIIPLSLNACRIIDNWISLRDDNYDFMFLPLDRSSEFIDTQMDVHTAANAVRKRASQAGLVEVSPIDLRYTYINILYSKGVNLERVQQLAGLSSIEAVNKYVHPPTNEAADTVDIPYYD